MRLQFEHDGSQLDVAGYRDSRGRYLLPALNPHWPVAFYPNAAATPAHRQEAWLHLTGLLAEEMLTSGTRGLIALPPEITDPRPWLAAGFRLQPQFTYYIDFPYDIGSADPNVRKTIRKASRCGLVVREADSVDDVLGCLTETESRQDFNLRLTRESLERGLQLLGRETLRLYVCYAPNGDAACARIVLHTPGGRACGLVAATKDGYRSAGANQLLAEYVLEDLQNAGARGFNFCGANIKSVASAKANFGGRLMPQYGIEGYDYLPLRRMLGRFLRYRGHRLAVRRSRSPQVA